MKFVNYEVIAKIKNNVDYYFIFFSNKDYEKNLLGEFLHGYYTNNDIPYIEIDYDMSISKFNDRKDTDFSNAKKIYEAYKFLSESQASDERLWTGLALEKNNMEYLFYRWGDTSNTIRYRVVYHAGGKRGMMYHGLGRLWWFAHISVLSDNDYSLTEFAFKYPHILEKLIYRNFSNSRHICHSVIKGIRSFIDAGGIYSTKKIDELYKYVSLIGGNRLLDAIPEEELVATISNYLHSL